MWICGCAAQEHADHLTFSFEAPLKEYVRMVKSAKAVMADRSLALSTLQSARSDMDGKRTKLAKLRGTPGIKVLPFMLGRTTGLQADLPHPSLGRCSGF